MEPMRPNSIARFGTFEVSFQSGEVRRAGLKIRIQQQPLKVLQILLDHRGEVVTRDQLRIGLGAQETFGDFDQALNIAIGKLRSALGDSTESPRYIETLPKRGYRFIADVTVIDAGARAERLESPAEATGAHELKLNNLSTLQAPLPQPVRSATGALMHRLWTTPRTAVAVVLALSVSILGAYLALNRTSASPRIRSLAVLPLDNLSGDGGQDYFADGMTEELITDLAQIRALRVVSRTSVMMYKGTRKPLPEIARELNVDAVVEGSVLRFGDQVRITAQLIQVPADKHLWANSYQGNVRDTLAVQNQVASAIAEQIRIEITPQEKAALKKEKPVDPEAHEAYLKGRYFWNQRTAAGFKNAVIYFNQAVARDPGYAAAYSGLADTYALLGDWQYSVMTPKEAMPKAKAAAKKALELDDSLGEAHASLAFCLEGFDWDFAAADKEFQRAIELSPGYATAHHWYAWHLSNIGRGKDAIAEMEKAENLDPISPIVNADLAELLLIEHLPDESIQQSLTSIEMNPDFAYAHAQLAQAYIEKRMFKGAVRELQKAIQISGENPALTANLARAYTGLNRKPEAVALLNNLKGSSVPDYAHAIHIAMIYTALGDKDEALIWLNQGYEERFNPGVLTRPCFDPLRSDPRFQDILRRVGLPAKIESAASISGSPERLRSHLTLVARFRVKRLR
jgi:TolB-like protein/DNA-binding winged helix-turn-helix (wHTH) protein/Flp pilus assembly protein TadD